ncbi:uncharacterized protein EI97DRAFT_102943 [Westerdykella ornata]|uniref:Uncharacterized protein n=1 Tax=Westerdykella ornata TaxID=318751 RepID=A0A6A6JH70_WESOR|nr:uncharacterized protein EI97DRAFT_102943 [Westerdykella ornata]KAF2274579.1 hypothetical protein EI97DRAFT_102943 [Westerdykella ornata]
MEGALAELSVIAEKVNHVGEELERRARERERELSEHLAIVTARAVLRARDRVLVATKARKEAEEAIKPLRDSMEYLGPKLVASVEATWLQIHRAWSDQLKDAISELEPSLPAGVDCATVKIEFNGKPIRLELSKGKHPQPNANPSHDADFLTQLGFDDTFISTVLKQNSDAMEIPVDTDTNINSEKRKNEKKLGSLRPELDENPGAVGAPSAPSNGDHDAPTKPSTAPGNSAVTPTKRRLDVEEGEGEPESAKKQKKEEEFDFKWYYFEWFYL